MDYQYLELSQQRQQLEARLRDLENQHFNASVARLTFEAAGDTESLKAQDASLAKIDAEYRLVEDKLQANLQAEERGLGPRPAGPAEDAPAGVGG
jgi:chromosome segregation ATPase